MYTCLNCGAGLPKRKSTKNKYCNVSCQQQKQSRDKINAWLQGDDPGWTGKTRQLKEIVRNYLFKVRGTACSLCGWDLRHQDGSVLTEIDHIDGDAENCRPDNLRVVCPNCHALTPNISRKK